MYVYTYILYYVYKLLLKGIKILHLISQLLSFTYFYDHQVFKH